MPTITPDVPVTAATQPAAWRGFAPGPWTERIDVRDFIQRNYALYEGDAAFLAPATERTDALWARLGLLFEEERRRGVLDVSQVPSSITAHEPGYIDQDAELIVGLQTDAPLKRAIFPNGGFRMVEAGLTAYGYEVDPVLREVFTKYRKSHNDGVFDAYTPEILAARRSGIVTGLPDAYGRGRIIGDYRRVALYGIDRLMEEKKTTFDTIVPDVMNEETMRDREEMTEQYRALKELKEMAASYGYDISKPAQN